MRTLLLATVVLAMLPASAAAAPQPFGHACTAQNGVRYGGTAVLAPAKARVRRVRIRR